MRDDVQTPPASGWRKWLSGRVAELRQREGQVILILALVIGALTGLVVVAFILLTERMGMRLYPAGGAPWRRLLFPVAGSNRMSCCTQTWRSLCAPGNGAVSCGVV